MSTPQLRNVSPAFKAKVALVTTKEDKIVIV